MNKATKTITIEINERTKAGKAILEVARLFADGTTGVKIIEENYNAEGIEKILKTQNLSWEEESFYRKFSKAIAETKAVEAGQLKPRPLEEVLDEI